MLVESPEIFFLPFQRKLESSSNTQCEALNINKLYPSDACSTGWFASLTPSGHPSDVLRAARSVRPSPERRLTMKQARVSWDFIPAHDTTRNELPTLASHDRRDICHEHRNQYRQQAAWPL